MQERFALGRWQMGRSRVLDLGLLALLALLAAVGLLRIVGFLFAVPPQPDFFASYYGSAQALNTDQPLYTLRPPTADPAQPLGSAAVGGAIKYTVYIYPPTAAALFRPLAYLSPWGARVVWYALNLGLFALLVWLINQTLGLFKPRYLPLAGLALLGLPAVYDTLLLGQINLLIAVCVAGAVYAATRLAGWRGDVLAGGLLGLAAMIKLYPVVLAVLLVAHRRVRATLALGLSLGLLLGFGMLWGGGWRNTQTYFLDVLPNLSTTLVTSPINQSIRAAMGRLFSVNTFRFAVLSVDNPTAVTTQPLLDAPLVGLVLGYALVGTVVLVTAGALLVLAWRDHASPTALLLNSALLVPALLLVTPISWDHYYVLLALPFAVLWQIHARHSMLVRRLLLIAAILIVLQRYWRWLTLYVVSPWLMMFGFLGVVLLWLVALGCVRLRLRSLTNGTAGINR